MYIYYTIDTYANLNPSLSLILQIPSINRNDITVSRTACFGFKLGSPTSFEWFGALGVLGEKSEEEEQ